MLTRFNKKLHEFDLNNYDIVNHVNHKHQPYKLSTKNNHFPSYETIKANYDNISSSNQFNFQSLPTKPFNYVNPIPVKSEKESEPSTTIKGKSSAIKSETKQLIPIKTSKLIRRSKSGKSVDRWSVFSDLLNSDDDSVDYSRIGFNEMTKCEQIRKHLFRLKTVLLIISVTGLIYQAYELSEIYFRYPTIVDVLIEQNEKIVLPSITVCTPIQITPTDLEKMFTGRPEVNRTLNRFDSDEKLKLNEKKAAKLDYLRKYFQTIYLNQATVNLSTFLDKSIQETRFVRSCYLSIINSSDSQIRLPCKRLSNPMITLTSNEKCFTYFSEINENYESIDNFITFDEDGSAATAQIQVILQLNVSFDANYDINLPSFLYIHASNEIMAKSNRYAIEPNRRYDVFYWRTVSERLEPLYCRSYSRSVAYPQSQIDCVNRCSTEYTFIYCKCLLFKPPVRIETIPLSVRVCPQIEDNFIRNCRRRSQGDDSKACRTSCTDGCIEQNFDYSVTAHELTPDELVKIGSINQSNLIEIQVTRNLKPDVIYRQKYQLEFEQYFSNFCSLLGFWLEITVLTFYDQLKKKVFLLYRLTCYVKSHMKQKKRKVKPKLIKT